MIIIFMRYTTLIDISELPDVYRNKNARLLYMHIVLKSGYHDHDRDILDKSLRILAAEVGLTLSAIRHAVAQLEAAGLLKKEQGSWRVKKWIVQEIPTPRTQKTTSRTQGDADNLGARYNKEAEQYKQAVYKAVRSMTREQLQSWLEELQDGRSLRHGGVQLNANQANIAWLQKVIKSS